MIQDTSTYDNTIVILGFGSIGIGLLPLLQKHLPNSTIKIVTSDCRNQRVAIDNNIEHTVVELTKYNYNNVLSQHLSSGDFLVNLTTDVSTVDLITWCQTNNVMYIDTCIQPWLGFFEDTNLSLSERSNHALREQVLPLKKADRPTAIIAHGANPGLVNHFVKQSLVDIATSINLVFSIPDNKEDWATLAQRVGLKVIHISEKDSQTAQISKNPDEFINTWSIDGFVNEATQPAELGWGSHERHKTDNILHHSFGSTASVYLTKSGCLTKARGWTPSEGQYHGWIITHNESLSISDYFTTKDTSYRPSVYYVYHPCDLAVLSIDEFVGKEMTPQEKHTVMLDEISNGMDELGVLLMGDFGAYWYGSQLTIEDARNRVKYNNATSLQVTAPLIAAIIWAINNPTAGVVEADELPYRDILKIANPYIEPLVGVSTTWSPIEVVNKLSKRTVDLQCPWQFINFIV